MTEDQIKKQIEAINSVGAKLASGSKEETIKFLEDAGIIKKGKIKHEKKSPKQP
jgi:DNA-binding PadR family transcriptional regulator